MKRKALLLALAALLAPAFASAVGQIGEITSYDAVKKTGLLRWVGTGPTGTQVSFLVDPGCPVLKVGDRVYAGMRPVPQKGVMSAPENSFLENLYVTGLVTPAPAAPAASGPAGSVPGIITSPIPAAAKAPAAPMGVVKSFDAVRGEGILVPDGQYIGLAFRPWPGFVFTPGNGAHLRYAQDQQFGQTILWAAPPAQ